jgi:hypothetical protein
MRTEVQPLSGDDLERNRINLHEPARVVGNPDGSVAERDALRATENEWSADTRLVFGFNFEIVEPRLNLSSSLPVQTKPAPNAITEPK